MEYIELEKTKLDLNKYKKRSALDSDYKHFIDKSTSIFVNGNLEIVYIDDVNEDLNIIFEAINNIKYIKNTRSSGLISTSRIFGYSPKIITRNQPCRLTTLATEFPKQHFIVEQAAKIAKKYYEKYNPEKALLHTKTTNEFVLPQYRISDTMYTSGIINENNPLKYHFDSGNFVGTWSAMFAFRKNTKGGHLSIPELNVGIEIKNNSLLLFDGQSLLHGVTPIQKLSKDAKRFTIVYYSLKQMWNCKPIDEEIIEMRKRRDDIERRKAGKE